MLSWKSSKFFSGHLTGILFCLYKKLFIRQFFIYWNAEQQNSCVRRGRISSEKENFISKELGICLEDSLDCVSFLPPTSYCDLATQRKQSFSWLTRNLHGIELDTGNYPYPYLKQIVQCVCLRNPGAIFYAKGEQKLEFFSDLLECTIIDLNSLACPSISVNSFTQNCQTHSKGNNNFYKHCAKDKDIFYVNLLTNERGSDESGSTPVTELNNLVLDYAGRESESFTFQRRNHKNRNSIFTEKSSIHADWGRISLIR